MDTLIPSHVVESTWEPRSRVSSDRFCDQKIVCLTSASGCFSLRQYLKFAYHDPADTSHVLSDKAKRPRSHQHLGVRPKQHFCTTQGKREGELRASERSRLSVTAATYAGMEDSCCQLRRLRGERYRNVIQKNLGRHGSLRWRLGQRQAIRST